MAASAFFARWSKPEVTPPLPVQLGPEAVPADPAQTSDAQGEVLAPAARLTLEDAGRLDIGADVQPFMAAGVEESVRRLALKKLFADPHYNVMDGLDIYVGDYHTFVPMSATAVAALQHGRHLLDPLAQLAQPFMTLMAPPPAPVAAPAAEVPPVVVLTADAASASELDAPIMAPPVTIESTVSQSLESNH